MTTLGHRLALVELAELRWEVARLRARLVALGEDPDVVDLRDHGRQSLQCHSEVVQSK